MNRKYLKDQGFTEEQIDVIMAEHGRTMSRYVPKSEADALTTQLNEAKAKIIDPKDLEALNAKASSVATLEQQLAEALAKNTGIQKQADVKVKLVQAKVKDVDLLMPKIDLEKDLDPQLEALKTSHPYMFGDPVPNNPSPNPAGDPNASAFDQEVAALKAKIDATSF